MDGKGWIAQTDSRQMEGRMDEQTDEWVET